MGYHVGSSAGNMFLSWITRTGRGYSWIRLNAGIVERILKWSWMRKRRRKVQRLQAEYITSYVTIVGIMATTAREVCAMWVKLFPILLKILISVGENVVQWFLATEIKNWIMKKVMKRKRKEDEEENE